MMDKLIEWDKKILLYLNGHHAEWLDQVMYFITDTLAWLPLFMLLLYFIIRDYRYETWFVLISITLTILVADQFTTSFMKPYFERLRPSRDPSLEGLVHIVKGYKGGKFGFASSHAANTFGVATLLWLLLREKRKWIVVMFAWALLTSYTRIYLGLHYPGDILVGGLIGVLVGIGGYKFFLWLKKMADRNRANLSGGT